VCTVQCNFCRPEFSNLLHASVLFLKGTWLPYGGGTYESAHASSAHLCIKGLIVSTKEIGKNIVALLCQHYMELYKNFSTYL